MPTLKPNILWICLDALRADHLGCYGYRARTTSPYVDRLASEGARAEAAIAQGGYSLPSYATMFTGLYPPEHGALGNPDTLSTRLPVIQEHFKRARYRTACIGSNPYFHDYFRLSRGFEHVRHYGPGWPGTRFAPDGAVALRPASKLSSAVRWLGLQDSGGARVCRLAEAFIAEKPRDPWFCFVHLMETHAPYTTPVGVRLRMRPSPGEFLASPFTLRRYANTVQLHSGGEEALRRTQWLYDASVRHSDALVRRLMTTLQRRGLLDGALVIICADHGTFMGERGLLRHIAGLGGELSRVPLILWGEGVDGASTIGPGPVELRDIPHTLCAFAGLEPLDQTARPARDLLSPEPVHANRTAYAWRTFLRRGLGPRDARCVPESERQGLEMLRTAEWEYMQYEDGRRRLYRVGQGDGEPDDRAAEEPQLVSEFAKELAELKARMRPRASADPVEDMPVDAEARLRDLGYL